MDVQKLAGRGICNLGCRIQGPWSWRLRICTLRLALLEREIQNESRGAIVIITHGIYNYK